MACEGGGKGVKEKPGKGRKKSMQGEEEEEGAEETYYDAMKKDMTDRAARTKVALPLSIHSSSDTFFAANRVRLTSTQSMSQRPFTLHYLRFAFVVLFVLLYMAPSNTYCYVQLSMTLSGLIT